MDLVRPFAKRVSYDQSQNDAFVLIIHESGPNLKPPIVIGAFEAQSTALEFEKNVIPPRPLAHDLFEIFADASHIKVKRVIIYKLEEGIFYSNMLYIQNGEERTTDAHTSDAIALTLRFNASTYTYRDIMQKVGIYILLLNEESQNSVNPSLDDIEEENDGTRNRYSKYSLTELKKMLSDYIEDEDYEIVVHIRGKVSKRNSIF